MSLRLIQPSQLGQRPAQSQVRIGQIRPQAQGGLVMLHRPFPLALLRPDKSEAGVGFRQLRIKLHRALEIWQRRLSPSLPPVCPAKVIAG